MTAAEPVRRRPAPVTYVALLAVAAGGYHLVTGILRVAEGGSTSQITEGVLGIALGLAAAVIAAGALRMRQWAWVAFMTWGVVGLTNELLRHFFYENVNYRAMALETLAVLALTPLEVQVAFGIRRERT